MRKLSPRLLKLRQQRGSVTTKMLTGGNGAYFLKVFTKMTVEFYATLNQTAL